ncbi:Protein kinase domain-containing protein [Caenorhabditis elegans]|uniref:Protein kinase domain-containing protein n=1 Tax=Caenorhabditis elegans TaxID=6239 RepID=A0A5E4LWR3_CAEEL|nr:Protein kinase domain-containing protein [Caenorhabditis elegans]VVC12345.1 Protein kinase domain-containing protein [Caenorhabditis elegans]
MMIVSTPNLPKTSICLTVEDFTEPLRRRSLPKEESPRSGLKPHDTLGADDRRQSACSIAERRIEEHRKYSSYGIEAPTPIGIPSEEQKSPERSPSITYNTRQPVRSLSAGWKESFRRKLNIFRRPSPSSLSSRSTQHFLSPSPEMSCKTNQESVKMKKSISFSETTRNALRRSFRHKNVPACSSEEDRVSTARRNSLFVKRGSVTMEPIKKVDLEEVYTVNKQLGTGRFGFIKLAEHKQSKQRIAIKFFPRPQTKQADFVREYNYSFFLSPHQNIIDTYEGMFQSSDDTAYFFVQEFCPRASLREAVEATNQAGIGEANTKKVFAAVLSAIEFMHDENLVHRNLKAENILIFDANDYSKVKVTDFGLTRKVDTTVKYLEYVNNYHAAELCDTVVNEKLVVNKSTDIWALGIIFFYCMKGKFPWQKASIMCKPYWEWEQWLKRKNPALPKKFNPFSEKALKLFKKSLTPRFKDRWTAKDMRKCLAKEKLLKSVKRPEEDYYVMIDTASKSRQTATSSSGEPQDPSAPAAEQRKQKSTLQQWISTTLTAMAEISEQVVSARDD